MEATSENRSPGRLFSWVERVGNKVPNPFLLFVYLIVVLMVATAIISALDLAVKNPSNGEMVRVNNLLSVAGIQWILPNIIKNFSSFTPLGSILALVIGAGLSEKVGAVYCLLQPYLVGCGAGGDAAARCADLPGSRPSPGSGTAGGDCWGGVGFYCQSADRHH